MICKWRTTRGCRALRKHFQARGRSVQRDLAAQLGTTEQVIHAWKIGYRRPGPDFRDALARVAGIPSEWWKTPQELRKSARLERVHVEAPGSSLEASGN